MEIRIPDIGDVDSVEVIEILVAVGDAVAADDPLIVIESDKASMEVPATAAGTVASIEVALGDNVAQGDLIARLEGDDAATGAAAESGAESAPKETSPSESPEPSAAEALPPSEPSPSISAPASATTSIDVSVPDIGEADDVSVVELAVEVGDQVAVGDLLLILESDKASMEVPSDTAGRVTSVHVAIGDSVEQGSRLVTLEVAASAASTDSDPSAAESQTTGANADTVAAPAPAVSPSKPPPVTTATIALTTDSGNKQAVVYAGPAVRRLARELGVDLSQVSGTGNNGRIVKEDVNGFVKSQLASGGPSTGGGIPGIPEVDFAKFGPVETQALGRVREVGAQNLHRSWLNVVHVTQHDEVDITDLEAFRKSLKPQAEQRGIKVTPLAFIVKAVCAVLKEFPTFNSSLDATQTHHILKRYYHIGLAVDTDYGLVVPVIRDADTKGIWELSEEIAELAEKARQRKLGMTDLQGGSFSVSSLGGIGGTGFTPIINAPEVAILGVSRMTMKPVWNGSEFAPGKMLPLSLSYDHRAINGAEAGRFVFRLTQVLGDVRQLVL